MIGHRIKCGARVAAAAASRGDVLGPDAAFTWMSLGRYAANLALEREKVNDDKRKVPDE